MATPKEPRSSRLPDDRVWILHDSKDIRASSRIPGFPGPISPFVWRFYTHRLNSASRWFLLTSFFFLLLGSTSLDLQVFVPFAYVLGVGAVVIIVTIFMRPHAAVRAEHATRIAAGERLVVEVTVTNTGRWKAFWWTIIPYRLPPAIDPGEPDGVVLSPLVPGAKGSARVHLLCYARGRYVLRGWRIQTEFPFGLLRAYSFCKEDQALLVYPRYSPLEQFDIPVGLRIQPGGIALASLRADSYEFLGNREYRDGDNIRDIDWRATARMDRPIVREYREEFLHRVAVLLDTQTDNTLASTDDFERAISFSAAVCDWIARQDNLVDIFAAGPEVYHLLAGKGLATLEQILDILACLEPSDRAAFTEIEAELAPHLTQITTVVCIFLDWDESRQVLVQRLAAEGVGVKVIVVRDRPCTMSVAVTEFAGADPIVLTKEMESVGALTL